MFDRRDEGQGGFWDILTSKMVPSARDATP
jgi:hypothetical protein